MMKIKEMILVVAMMGVLIATAFANDNDGFDQRRSELMKERITNFKENIKPKIDAQRNKLESSLSTEDKNEINRLREEIIKQRLIENEFLFEGRAARIKGEDFDEGLWQEIEAQKIVIENLQDQAKLIANKYRPEIDDLVANLREELKEENGNFGPRRDGSGQGYDNGRRGPGNSEGFRGRGYGQGPQAGFRNGPGLQRGFGPMGFGPNMNGHLDIVTFLLWDVSRG
jgi:hypothetical protein